MKAYLEPELESHFHSDSAPAATLPGSTISRTIREDIGCNLPAAELATLDRTLARLHANKAELFVALDRPDIPLQSVPHMRLGAWVMISPSWGFPPRRRQRWGESDILDRAGNVSS